MTSVVRRRSRRSNGSSERVPPGGLGTIGGAPSGVAADRREAANTSDQAELPFDFFVLPALLMGWGSSNSKLYSAYSFIVSCVFVGHFLSAGHLLDTGSAKYNVSTLTLIVERFGSMTLWFLNLGHIPSFMEKFENYRRVNSGSLSKRGRNRFYLVIAWFVAYSLYFPRFAVSVATFDSIENATLRVLLRWTMLYVTAVWMASAFYFGWDSLHTCDRFERYVASPDQDTAHINRNAHEFIEDIKDYRRNWDPITGFSSFATLFLCFLYAPKVKRGVPIGEMYGLFGYFLNSMFTMLFHARVDAAGSLAWGFFESRTKLTLQLARALPPYGGALSNVKVLALLFTLAVALFSSESDTDYWTLVPDWILLYINPATLWILLLVVGGAVVIPFIWKILVTAD